MNSECRVLVVDDEEDLLEALTERICRRGLEAVGARSGEDALEMMEHRQFDVVILDVGMPKMNGIEALMEIKQRHPLTEVVMLSGHADTDLAIRGLELGAFDYFVKPVGFEDLLYRIEDAHRTKLLDEVRK